MRALPIVFLRAALLPSAGNGSTAAPWQGTLRWTYTWIGAASAWTVSGWSWSTY